MAFVSGIRALISTSQNRPVGKVLAIISLICCLLSFLGGLLIKVKTVMLLPVDISLVLYLIGVKRYNQ